MSQLPFDPAQLTPRAIVEELDRYIIGQHKAKRAVAIALRNRWRRQQVPQPLREEITPKNIIMIGPTGVGKTEIARRLAKLVQAPFIKLEASKFTEVGYVGRDVDSMIRDLMEISIKLVKDEEQTKVQQRAKEIAEERLLDLLLPPAIRSPSGAVSTPSSAILPEPEDNSTREKLRESLRGGKLDDREVEVEVDDHPHSVVEVFSPSGMDQMGFDMSQLQRMLGGGNRKKRRKVRIPEALVLLAQQEAAKLIDMDKVQREALLRTEQSGIIFLDEIDKIAAPHGSNAGPDVSRQGVQRDLLPIVEGSTVTTKYGPVKTDHILFIAAGAFHIAKPSDLIPELQGRFPIRVELEPLTEQDLIRILSEPENSLTKQYQALLLTENVKIYWQTDAIEELARLATEANQRLENIGARRLQTILERVLEDLSFEAPDLGTFGERTINITPAYVEERVRKILEDQDLSRYIL